MAGIISCGAYIPAWRLSREAIAMEWRGVPMPGEKAVANFDEDSITMAVAAALDCLKGKDREAIDGLFFASTSSPYKEKQAATTVSVAADLRPEIMTADYSNSLRAGTIALRAALDTVAAGTAKQVLVTTADMRLGAPRSPFERDLGDGAAAILVGDGDLAVEIEGYYSIRDERVGVWRPDGARFLTSAEDRFIQEEGYLKVMQEAISKCMSKFNLTSKDISKIACYGPDARRHTQLVRSLGFDPKTQVQNPLLDMVGCTGSAHALILMVAALEEAKPGDRILMASYGDGSDVYILRATEYVTKVMGRRGAKGHLQSKLMVPDYSSYAQWRGIVDPEPMASRPPQLRPSPAALVRDVDDVLRFHGCKCKSCGTIQYPRQRVCTRCHTKDNFEDIRLSDKKGKVFTYTLDYIAGTIDVPLVDAIINLDGGGRVELEVTDRDVNEIKIDMPVELTFRKLYFAGDIHNYFWKATPVRT